MRVPISMFAKQINKLCSPNLIGPFFLKAKLLKLGPCILVSVIFPIPKS